MNTDNFQLPNLRLDDSANYAGIVVEGVSKSFGQKKILDQIDLFIERGETLVIIGRSGVGKSVLLKNLVRLLEPESGKIWIEGIEVTDLSTKHLMELRKKFGMLFQGGALFDSLTVAGNIGLMLQEHTTMSPTDIDRRVSDCLAMVGLQDTGHKLPSELSGGMKKRASLARAIVMQPKYILYDEPTTGLDPITSDAINDLIIKLQTELGVTSIIVTHDMPSAFKIADRIAMLRRGKIVFVGTVDEVKNTDHPMVRQFIEGRAHGPLGTF